MSTDNKKKKCAIIYFGLLRSAKDVYKSHVTHINNELANENIDYKIFIHTWKTKNDIQKVWGRTINIKQNYEDNKYFNPYKFLIENQEEFIDKLDFSKYFYKHIYDTKGHSRKGEWLPYLVKNHLCALESQKRALKMVENENEHFDYVIFVRPDSLFKQKLPVKKCIDFLNKVKNGIIIPSFGSWEGLNDKFAMMNMSNSTYYANRIDVLPDYRKSFGRIVSEKCTKYIVSKYYKPLLISFHFKTIRPSK